MNVLQRKIILPPISFAMVAQAVANDEFVLAYQPIFNVMTNEVIGAEALIRWQRPSGLVSPDSFLHHIERSTIEPMVTEQVFQQAMKAQAEWVANGFDIKISVNVSPFMLTPHLVDIIERGMSQHKITPNQLEVEITERFQLEGITALEVTKAIQDLGCRIAIDDFGTGHSGFQHLSDMDPNTVKIDRLFISAIQTKKGNKIVRAIIETASILGIEIVAEGVERESQLVCLRELDAYSWQGFHGGMPMLLDQFTTWLEDRQRMRKEQKTPAIDTTLHSSQSQ